MKHEHLLVLRICLLLVSVYAGVSGQHAYEAYGVAEFRRESSTKCTTEVCVLDGFVGTMQVSHGSHTSDSTAAQAAVYGLQEETGAMQLLGIAAASGGGHMSDHVSVTFNWQDARVVILVYVRRNISNRDVELVVREGKNTTKFFLGAPNQCILCRSSATVITGMEVRKSGFTIQSAASGVTVTSVCSGGSLAPCPTSSNLPRHTSPALPSPSLTSIADPPASSRSVPPLVMTPSASMSEIPSSPSDTTAIPSMTTSTSVVTVASSPTTIAGTTFTTTSLVKPTSPIVIDSFSQNIATVVPGPVVAAIVVGIAMVVGIPAIIVAIRAVRNRQGQQDPEHCNVHTNPHTGAECQGNGNGPQGDSTNGVTFSNQQDPEQCNEQYANPNTDAECQGNGNGPQGDSTNGDTSSIQQDPEQRNEQYTNPNTDAECQGNGNGPQGDSANGVTFSNPDAEHKCDAQSDDNLSHTAN